MVKVLHHQKCLFNYSIELIRFYFSSGPIFQYNMPATPFRNSLNSLNRTPTGPPVSEIGPQAFPSQPAGHSAGPGGQAATSDRSEQGRSSPQPLVSVKKVRQEFPESWVWMEILSGYISSRFCRKFETIGSHTVLFFCGILLFLIALISG